MLTPLESTCYLREIERQAVRHYARREAPRPAPGSGAGVTELIRHWIHRAIDGRGGRELRRNQPANGG
jgi:hypothetical protein